LSNDASSVHWTELSPQPPSNLFVPQDSARSTEVQKLWRLSDIMNLNGDPAPGIVTTHDEFAISWSREEAAEKVERLLATRDEAEARSLFRLCSQAQWNHARAKKELAGGSWKRQLAPVLYRPFDVRWTVYNSNVAVHRRERVMAHMLAGKNLALITTRQTRDDWDALAAQTIATHKSCAAYDINSLFPLYLYPSASKRHLFDDAVEGVGRRPNLAPEFIKEFSEKLGLTFMPEQPEAGSPKLFGPEDVFDYVYAIFHWPTYRKRYAEFLKIDFPRVPLTSDKKLFWKLVTLGRELVALHLLESPKVNDFVTKYPKKGSDTVGQVRYVEPNSAAVSRKPSAVSGRVFINDEQYFEGVKPEWFGFHIGGYQVLQKWLKDRKDRKLSNDDITHYQRVVVAIKETIRLMSEIDKAIPQWPVE
jgi:predicted helicase